jgi:hypothetical protein
MDTARTTGRRRTALGPQWRRTAHAVFEWWWNLDRRRHTKQMDTSDRSHPLDEAFVVVAMAHQLEEIRNLPEVAP